MSEELIMLICFCSFGFIGWFIWITIRVCQCVKELRDGIQDFALKKMVERNWDNITHCMDSFEHVASENDIKLLHDYLNVEEKIQSITPIRKLVKRKKGVKNEEIKKNINNSNSGE